MSEDHTAPRRRPGVARAQGVGPHAPEASGARTGSQSPSGRVMALDLGEKRIGVAVCDPDGVLASPYKTIDRSGDVGRDHREVFGTVAELGAGRVVVGLPLDMSGRRGAAAAATEKEVEKLREALSVPVELLDERLTTVSAARSLQSAGMNSRRQRRGGRIDQEAATLLLQAWLDARRNEPAAKTGQPARKMRPVGEGGA